MWRSKTTDTAVLDSEVLDRKQTKSNTQFVFRKPAIGDGGNIYRLITQCPPLDVNSAYCNFLQATHFKETCVVAEREGDVQGFISGYIRPEQPDTFFVWQVAVSPKARGEGLALSMIEALLARKVAQNVHFIETTITEDNAGSWALFKKVDRLYGSGGQRSVFLDEQEHFNGEHDTEYLFRIPLKK
ncbi:diaminobutyrate acetyltransferase [Salinivibrio sp. MA351]|jgi:L-2,4-diaminobutyric acid acetyltransferase|uniref:L-2,4-diaminobutyric acid acetyltransferase n=1 Tax=Salinivibrio costicola subsp. alcaliphilus TaxID=272773 RepID=A0ABX3KPW4_SALCS|nr:MULTISPECIES: diaminobutyrate acetyltransferase [Salinivibrio]OOE96855.1 diaminobutyrate acetyltransferase [Salinivibrio sp. MA351]OOF04699.1 diaminobutyrate acetyltransferase [Salinivibrio sp. MA607]OOF33601.1 diaminobutyrate acetyltransferase [Salinivibrio costicola subsp. alcaliphilus]